MQLSRLQAEWEIFGRGVNTRQLSAQDSEHLNKVFKDIESSISDHHAWTAAARRSQCTTSHGAFGRSCTSGQPRLRRCGSACSTKRKMSEGSRTSTTHLPSGAACLHVGEKPTRGRQSNTKQFDCTHSASCLAAVEQSIQGFFDLAVVASEEARDALVHARDALVPADGVEDRKPKKRNK